MKKIVIPVLILALLGGAYFWIQKKQHSETTADISSGNQNSSQETGSSQGPSAQEGTPAQEGTSAGDGTSAPGSAPGSQEGTAVGGGVPNGETPDSAVPWIQGSIGLRGDHVGAVDAFVSAVEERSSESLLRFFSEEMKARKSVAGRGKLKAFIRQSLMGEGFFGGLTNPDTRKIRSVQEGVFQLIVRFEVSNPHNDEVDIPVTLKFQFEKIKGTYLITQVAETRG